MKHEVILNKKQPKQMTIADVPNGCFFECEGRVFLKAKDTVYDLSLGTFVPYDNTFKCRILEPGESITINIK
jgi:hypothetical protein